MQYVHGTQTHTSFSVKQKGSDEEKKEEEAANRFSEAKSCLLNATQLTALKRSLGGKKARRKEETHLFLKPFSEDKKKAKYSYGNDRGVAYECSFPVDCLLFYRLLMMLTCRLEKKEKHGEESSTA